jgi:hypothetical protein
MNGEKSGDIAESRDEVCVPCEDFLGGPEPEACIHFKDYLSVEEEEVLAMLRQLKEQARTLRGKMRGLEKAMEGSLPGKPQETSSGEDDNRSRADEDLHEEWKACSQQLDELRALWKRWELRKEEANRRKMVLLGHLPWEDATRI